MKIVLKITPTIILINLPKKFWFENSERNDKIIVDEKLAMLENFIVKDAITILVIIDRLENTIFLFSKKISFL